MEIRRNSEIPAWELENCHDGEGRFGFRSLLDGWDCRSLYFMHNDAMPAGSSIGLHEHTGNQEIYYLISGKGILTYDENEYEMNAGDISLCDVGQSHAFKATEDSVLIVVGCK